MPSCQVYGVRVAPLRRSWSDLGAVLVSPSLFPRPWTIRPPNALNPPEIRVCMGRTAHQRGLLALKRPLGDINARMEGELPYWSPLPLPPALE